MKICLINNLYKPYNRGGAEEIVGIMREGLEQAGHEVFIITSRPWFSNPPTRTKTYYISSLYNHLHIIPAVFRLFYHIWDIVNPIAVYKISKILKDENPDAIITHNIKGLGMILPKTFNHDQVKHIHYLHDIQLLHPSGLMIKGKEGIIDSFPAKTYQFINNWIFDQTRKYIAPTEWIIGIHRKRTLNTNSREYIIPSPFFCGPIKTPPPEPGDNPNRIRITYVGQIEKHKGLELLIESFADIAKKSKNKNKFIELCIIGGGSLQSILQNRYRHIRNIIFTGKKQKSDVIRILACSNCLAVPSLCYENSPSVIHEALSCGVPVIAARIGGITEIIREHGGILFAPADLSDLTHKLQHFINNHSYYESESKKFQAAYARNSLSQYISRITMAIKD